MTAPTYIELPLSAIDPPPLPIRQAMSEESVDELAASILQHGQLQPSGVVRVGERFTISYGHRRYCAVEKLGDRLLRCLLFEGTYEAMLGAQLDENVQQRPMRPADEAVWFAQLLEGLQIDTTALADKLQKPRRYVEDRLALLAGDAAVFEAVRQERIPLGVAHALNDCVDEGNRHLLLDMAMHREATVRTVAGWVAEMNAHGVLTARALAAEGADVALPDPDAPPPVIVCSFCNGAKNPHLLTHEWIHEYCAEARDAMLGRALAAGPGGTGV